MTLTEIKTSQKRTVAMLVEEIIKSLRLRSYADVYEHDETIERITLQRTSLLPRRIAEVIDWMVMDELHLHFKLVGEMK